MKFLALVAQFVGRTFALWTIAFAVAAYFAPPVFKPFAPWIVWLLGIVMFGMGLTLSPADFLEVARRPRQVVIGILSQFTIMPLLAFALTRLIPMPPEIAAGVILVGCCPGGTASNVMTYLSKGDTALSVTMTACTTLMAPLVTPALVWVFASAYLPVNAVAMFMSIVKVVLVPLALGIAVKILLPKLTENLVPVLPLISVVGIVLIVAAVVAVNQPKLAQSGLLVALVVIAHNVMGLLLGYWAARATGMGRPQQKALSIEVGMQNSGLGAALAAAHFSPLAAVPSAVFSVWHNVSGALLANWYRNR